MIPFLVAFWLGIAPLPLSARAAPGTWSDGATLKQPRAEIAATVLDGRILTVGGFGPGGVDLSSLEVFDPATNTWQTRSPMPQGLNHLGVAALDGVVYVAGGSVGGTPTSGLYAFDPLLDSWSNKADLPLRRSA